jgi:hypothetical protein
MGVILILIAILKYNKGDNVTVCGVKNMFEILVYTKKHTFPILLF